MRQVLGAISQYAVITTVAQLIKALRRDQFDNASNEDRLSHGLSYLGDEDLRRYRPISCSAGKVWLCQIRREGSSG